MTCAIMTPMRAQHHLGVNPQRWPGRLALWLAALLFALQVGFHAAMPEHMNMSQMLNTVLSGAVNAPSPAMSGMAMPAAPTAAAPGPDAPRPALPAHAGHADSLCCMPPLAPAPQFWVPPLLLPVGRLRVAVRAVAEALRIQRATARGPPRGVPATFSLV